MGHEIYPWHDRDDDILRFIKCNTLLPGDQLQPQTRLATVRSEDDLQMQLDVQGFVENVSSLCYNQHPHVSIASVSANMPTATVKENYLFIYWSSTM